MTNRFAVVLVGLVIIFGGVFFFAKNKANAPTSSGGKTAAQASNHVEGENAKGVTLVEYGDFECPACYGYYPLVKELVAKYQADISFQFVNFPLVSIHQHAMAAHRAAEAASIQGKFWEMHEKLYTNRQTWTSSPNSTKLFEEYATQIGLNVTKFKQDANSSAVNGIINADISKGGKLGVNSTPTFFLNGKKITQAPQDIEGFSKLIDNAIAEKQKQ